MNFVIDSTCPTCGSTIRHAVIDLHSTDRDAAIHSLKCANCGYEKTRVLSLRPAAAPPAPAETARAGEIAKDQIAGEQSYVLADRRRLKASRS
jgi:hypothetical protein